MLKITTYNDPKATIFHLEGRLAGPWVGELESCWRQALIAAGRPTIRIDLSGVTFIDGAGKNLLALLHQSGADLVAVDCMTKAVVDSIVGSHHPGLLPS